MGRTTPALFAMAILVGCHDPKGNVAGTSEPRTFAHTVVEVSRLTGSEGRPGRGGDGELLEGVFLFEVMGDAADFEWRHRSRLLEEGASLFVYQHGFGKGPDILGLAPTVDPFDVVRRVRTDAANYGHGNADVIAWLRDLDREEPFEVTGAGMDFVEGFFRAPVSDRKRLAVRIYAFCPDFVDQGLGLTEHGEPHELIERYFATNRYFFFWWD